MQASENSPTHRAPTPPLFTLNSQLLFDRTKPRKPRSEATKRDDMLFVASSGNNGTESGSQWLNYPSAYEGVVSVGAVNCANEVQRWSQKNARVDIVAPGEGGSFLIRLAFYDHRHQ
jgi:hypothetical protein